MVWHTLTRASGATRLLRDYKKDVRTVQLLGGWSPLDQMRNTSAWIGTRCSGSDRVRALCTGMCAVACRDVG